jgi:benzodiazapine receptor
MNKPAQPKDTPMDRDETRIPPGMALLAVAAVLGAAGLVASRYTPDPRHPRIARWYGALDKPGWKPPDPLFGAIWPVLESLHSYGAYRLMRSPSSPERNQAIGLWVADIGLATGWARLFFGSRSLTGGVVDAAYLVLSALGFVQRAAKVDRLAAWSAAPFLLWSVFGGLMSEALRERNPKRDGGWRQR